MTKLCDEGGGGVGGYEKGFGDWSGKQLGLRRRCLALALRLLRSPADAEDAVQEALVRGYRHSVSCRSAEDPVPWLMTITRRECARAARRRGERKEAELGTGIERASSDHSEVMDSTLDLRVAIGRLSEEERYLFGLRYVHDLTQAEIARTSGLPEGTVKTKLHRIRRRIRSRMEVK